MIEVGKHEVIVSETGLVKTQKGDMQIVVKFENAEGDSITAYLATSEAAWPYTQDKLANMGWDPVSNGFRVEDLNESPSPIHGNQCQIVVKEEEFEGKTRKKVSFINPPGGMPIERMESSEAQRFAAQLRSRLTGRPGAPARQPQPQRAAQPRPAASQDHANEDIPF